MKGLIRNNFYTVEGSLKVIILIDLIGMITIVFTGIYFPNNEFLIFGVIGGMLGASGALAGTEMQKDGASKWNKYELTMPISRKDVITARYISFALYILIGILMTILSVLLFYLVTDSVNLRKMGYGFAFGVTFAMSIPSFMTPLIIIFGADKNEVLLMVSAAIGIGLFLGGSVFLPPFFSNLCFIFSILLYFLSYLFSLCLYNRKEL